MVAYYIKQGSKLQHNFNLKLIYYTADLSANNTKKLSLNCLKLINRNKEVIKTLLLAFSSPTTGKLYL